MAERGFGTIGPGFGTIGIVGGGAWGTALAQAAARAGRQALLWARRPSVVEDINGAGVNRRYLPGVDLSASVRATGDLADLARADAVLLVPPAQHLRAACRDLAAHLRPGVPAVICAKGIEIGSGALLSEVVAAELPRTPVAVLSGPTFAAEVAGGLPAAVTIACADAALGAALVQALGSRTFRPYWSDDLAGTQIGGAVKNVLAIACGIVEGRRLGENARAALITRGLAEIGRLGLALGARRDTLMGLSGLGDLTLTCTSWQSRNTSLGVALGEGMPLEEVLAGRHTVAEGVTTAAAVVGLARRLGVEMPISEAVDAVLRHRADIDGLVEALMARPFKAEWE